LVGESSITSSNRLGNRNVQATNATSRVAIDSLLRPTAARK
jgi:hypothetical protein